MDCSVVRVKPIAISLSSVLVQFLLSGVEEG